MTNLLNISPARRRVLVLARWVGMITIACLVLLLSARVMGQGTTPTTPSTTAPAAGAATPTPTTPAAGTKKSLMSLFLESWDLFTILLVSEIGRASCRERV